MQKVQLPMHFGVNKPTIDSLLLSQQDQVKNPYKDELFSGGWSFPTATSSSSSSITSSFYQPQQPIKSFIDNNSSRNSYIHESKKFKFSQDYNGSNSSDESDNGEYCEQSPKQQQFKLNSNNNNNNSNMVKLLNNQSLPTFKQFQSQFQSSQQPTTATNNNNTTTSSFQNILSSSSSSSLHSSPSSSSSSPSYSIPSVTLQEQPHSPPSYPSSPLGEVIKSKQVQQWIQELHQIKKREYILLENLKYYTTNSSSDESDEDYEPSITTYQQPQPPSPKPIQQQTIQPPTQQQLLQLIQQQQSQQQQPQTITTTTTATSNQMVIQQQPSESIVCNRYIHPAIVVVVDQEVINQTSGYLIVNASLVQQNSKSNNNSNNNNNKNQLLQGVKSILVEKNGIVIFNKLKLNEVSAKLPNQLFSICFTLSDISSDKQIHIVSQITTTPFYVVAKPNKRKSDEIESSDEPSSPLTQKQINSMNSPPSSPSLVISNNTNTTTTPTTNKMEESLAITTSSDPNYIDITELLILPQKEAASRLGISESMLCKRFKECTRRKWPYRYLRKIDKFIKLLSLQNVNEIPKEEKEKLDRYILEREECLRPVKIRITGCLEKEDSEHFNNTNKTSSSSLVSSSASPPSSLSSPSPKSQIQNIINNDEIMSTSFISSNNNHQITNNNTNIIPRDTKLFNNFTTGGEGKGLENILETLEMLKHTRQ